MRTKPTNTNKRSRFWGRISIGLLSVLMLAAAPSQAIGLPSTDFLDQNLGISTPLGNVDASVQDGAAHACADLSAPALPALPALPIPLPVSLPDVNSLVDASVSTCIDADADAAVSEVTDLAEGTADQAVDQADGVVSSLMDKVRSALDGLFSLF